MTIQLLKDLHTTYKMYTYKRINLSVVSIKLIIYRHFSQTTTRGNTHFTTPSQIPYSRSDCTVFGPVEHVRPRRRRACAMHRFFSCFYRVWAVKNAKFQLLNTYQSSQKPINAFTHLIHVINQSTRKLSNPTQTITQPAAQSTNIFTLSVN